MAASSTDGSAMFIMENKSLLTASVMDPNNPEIVNIDTEMAQIAAKDGKPLIINYKPVNITSLANVGHTWQLDIRPRDDLYITGGPLQKTKFLLDHIHCHWDPFTESGSKHRVNNVTYLGELHFIHWNTDKFESHDKAIDQPKGIACLAVFLKHSDQANEELDKIVKFLKVIKHKNNRITLPSQFNPLALLPDYKSFFHYEGAVATSPNVKSHSWVIMMRPLNMTLEQLEEMRQMENYSINEKNFFEHMNLEEAVDENENYQKWKGYTDICQIDPRLVYKYDGGDDCKCCTDLVECICDFF